MPTSRELGEQFNLRDANPDQGGGLLYAIRYSPEALDLKMEAVLDRFFEMGFEFVEVQQDIIGIQTVYGDLDPEMAQRALMLAEELSVISDARSYQSFGWGTDHSTVSELVGAACSQVNNALENALTGSTEGKIEAFDTATMLVSQIVCDLWIADAQNGVLSNSERHAVLNLERVGAFVGRAVDGRHIVIGR